MNVRELAARLSAMESTFVEKMQAMKRNEQARIHELRSIHIELGGLQGDHNSLMVENKTLRQKYQQLVTDTDSLKTAVDQVSGVTMREMGKQVEVLTAWKTYREDEDENWRAQLKTELRNLEDKVSVLPNLQEQLHTLVADTRTREDLQDNPVITDHTARLRTLEGRMINMTELQKEMSAFSKWVDVKRDSDSRAQRYSVDTVRRLDDVVIKMTDLRTAVDSLESKIHNDRDRDTETRQEQTLKELHEKMAALADLQLDVDYVKDLMMSGVTSGQDTSSHSDGGNQRDLMHTSIERKFEREKAAFTEWLESKAHSYRDMERQCLDGLQKLHDKLSCVEEMQKEMEDLSRRLDVQTLKYRDLEHQRYEGLQELDGKVACIPVLQTKVDLIKELVVSHMQGREQYLGEQGGYGDGIMKEKFQLLDEMDSRVTLLTGWMTSKDARDMRLESGLKTQMALVQDLTQRTDRTENRLRRVSQSVSKVELEPTQQLVTGRRIKLDRCVGRQGQGCLIDHVTCCMTSRWDGDYVIGVIWAQEGEGEVYLFLQRSGREGGEEEVVEVEAANVGKTCSDDDVCSVQEVIRMKAWDRLWLEAERVEGGEAQIAWCFFYCWMLGFPEDEEE